MAKRLPTVLIFLVRKGKKCGLALNLTSEPGAHAWKRVVCEHDTHQTVYIINTNHYYALVNS